MRILKFAFTALLLLSPATLAAQEKIAFMSQRNGNAEIYVMNADGTNQLRLTFNPAFDDEPAFSRSGEKIAFMSFRDGNAEIYVMHADGSSQTRINQLAPEATSIRLSARMAARSRFHQNEAVISPSG